LACACATNRENPDLFQSWAHSSAVSPWGKVLADSEFEETILYADIDLSQVKEVREQIMTSMHKRKDIYELVSKIKI
jgi:omega-amidase